MNECKCDLRTKLVGDGCRYCNPQDYIDHLHDALEQKDTWVGLTDEELPPLVGDNGKYMELQQVRRFYKYIEAKLRSKNDSH